MKYRVTSFENGHAMALATIVEKSKPGDTISVNNEHLKSMATFKAEQLGKRVEVVVEGDDGN